MLHCIQIFHSPEHVTFIEMRFEDKKLASTLQGNFQREIKQSDQKPGLHTYPCYRTVYYWDIVLLYFRTCAKHNLKRSFNDRMRFRQQSVYLEKLIKMNTQFCFVFGVFTKNFLAFLIFG